MVKFPPELLLGILVVGLVVYEKSPETGWIAVKSTPVFHLAKRIV